MATKNSAAARTGAFAGSVVVGLARIESAIWDRIAGLGLPSSICLVGKWCVRAGLGAAIAFCSIFGLLFVASVAVAALLAAGLSKSSFKPSDCVQSFEYDHYSNGHHYKDGVQID